MPIWAQLAIMVACGAIPVALARRRRRPLLPGSAWAGRLALPPGADHRQCPRCGAVRERYASEFKSHRGSLNVCTGPSVGGHCGGLLLRWA